MPANSPVIFVVEDDEFFRELLKHNLSLNSDLNIRAFATGKDCLAHLNENPAVITLDYMLPDTNGTEMLKKIKAINPGIEVIIISEQNKIDTAVDLLKAGAYDYLVKSKDIGSRLLNMINNICKHVKLQERVTILEQEISQQYNFQDVMIGNSNAIKQVFKLMDKAVTNNITVTINGETGTGKEVVAKAIHYNSPRKNKAFVAVNMAAIPHELIESELFGHEKGSFTGATDRRIGKFEEANNGTLFLDEIGEMDLNMQAKLLRVLQEKEITRVGGNEKVKVDCRIIVATHRNLQEEVKNGRFREDLFYRLFGLQLVLPPLRERDKDAIILAKHFLAAFAKENKTGPVILSNEAQLKLLSYPYPGNVRELKSVVELAAVMTNTNTIEPNDIIFSTGDAITQLSTEELTLKEYTDKLLKLYLGKYDNNIKIVAKKLDIGVSTIYRLLKEHNIDV